MCREIIYGCIFCFCWSFGLWSIRYSRYLNIWRRKCWSKHFHQNKVRGGNFAVWTVWVFLHTNMLIIETITQPAAWVWKCNFFAYKLCFLVLSYFDDLKTHRYPDSMSLKYFLNRRSCFYCFHCQRQYSWVIILGWCRTIWYVPSFQFLLWPFNFF